MNDSGSFVRDFVGSGKPVASICHGREPGGGRPRSWTAADLVPSIRTDLRNAGADLRTVQEFAGF